MSGDLTTSSASGQELAAQFAFQVEQRIRVTIGDIRTAWVRLAEDLFNFQQSELWRDLGHSSFEAWLASPDIDLGRRWVYELISMWRDLVIDRHVKPDRLLPVNVSKVREVLPAIRRGQVTVEDALSDCETLGRDDLRKRYTGSESPTPGQPDTSSAVHTSSETEYAICHACGSRYPRRKEAA